MVSEDQSEKRFRGYKSLEICLNIPYVTSEQEFKIISEAIAHTRDNVCIYDPQLNLITFTPDYTKMYEHISGIINRFS